MDELHVIGYYPLPAFVVAEQKGLFAREDLRVNFEIATLAPEHNREAALKLLQDYQKISRAGRDQIGASHFQGSHRPMKI